jgi:hypothetical protein
MSVLTLLAVPSFAAAQSAPSVFVDAAIFSGFENFSNLETTQPVAHSNDLSGTVPGGTIAVGTYLGPRASLRVEGSFPKSTENDVTEGPPVGAPLSAPMLHYRDEQSMQSVSILGGYHLANNHQVRVSYLAGASFLRVRQGSRQTIHYPAMPPFQPEHTEETSSQAVYFIPAVVFGVDVAISLGAHVMLVPGARILGTAGATSLRPGVAIRWQP